jgi:DNA helicase II / ATP-dependent DNA helicase PcrA
MQSTSHIIICAAGGGKTTEVVRQALAETQSRLALVTYTRNNKREIERQIFECCPAIPSRIEVMTWFTFLLYDLARPYRRVLYDHRINGIQWVNDRSAKFTGKVNLEEYFFSSKGLIYSDKMSEFVCRCDHLSGGAVMRRLRQRFDRVIIDEVQDLAGYDLDLVEAMLNAGIPLTMVGDHRQATFSTNNSPKNKPFRGVKVVKKFRYWEKKELVTLTYRYDTYRCRQEIADLADSLFPDEPRTNSHRHDGTGHDGIFLVRHSEVDSYVRDYQPQVLRLDIRTDCHNLSAMNFGESKGLSFNRVIIFPHQLGERWLKTYECRHIEGSLAKLYVGITRARYSVAFVLDGSAAIPNVQFYQPAEFVLTAPQPKKRRR